MHPGILVPRTLGEALRVLVHRSGLDYKDLAGTVAINQNSLGDYINDKSVPSAQVLRRIAHSLARTLGEDPEEMWAELGSMLDEMGFVKYLAERLNSPITKLWKEIGVLIDADNVTSYAQFIEWAELMEPLAQVTTLRHWLTRAAADFALQGVTLIQARPEQVKTFLGVLMPESARETARETLKSFYLFCLETRKLDQNPMDVLE